MPIYNAMSFIEVFVTFMITWWMVFFLILPFGNVWDEPAQGMAASSPSNARLKLKFIISTIVTIIITLIVYYIMSK